MPRLLFCFLIFPIFLSAQINESTKDSLNFKANLSLTGFLQDGNVETIIFRAKSDVRFIPWRKWVFKTTNSYVYQEFGNKKADEDILSLNFLYLNPDRKVYPFVLGIISTNFRREIDLRYLVGAGVTFQLINKKDNWLKLSVSSEYDETKYSMTNFNQNEYDGDRFITTLRGTLWVSGNYEIFKKKVILTHEGYIQPSLLKGDNLRWQADLGLELPIWKFLNFKINYRHTFESIIVEGQKEGDRFLTFGFTLKNY